jgi:hypothetical protein
MLQKKTMVTRKFTNLSINDEYERATAFEESIRITGGIREQIDLSCTIINLKCNEGTA